MDVKTVTAEELDNWLKENDVVLIDVRLPEEYEIDFIPGALFMPLPQFTGKNVACEKKTILYCRSGRRSEAACRLVLAINKAADIYNLEGGILEWKRRGFQVAKGGT